MAQTMFGDVFSARQTGMEDLEKSAATLATLQPGRGSVYAAGMAGGMLGRGIGQAFGAQTPLEAKQAKLQEIQAQFEGQDITDPEVLGRIAQALIQGGLPDQGYSVLEQSREQKKAETSRITANRPAGSSSGTAKERWRDYQILACKDDTACIDKVNAEYTQMLKGGAGSESGGHKNINQDPVSGKFYGYNKDTNKVEWISAPDVSLPESDTHKNINQDPVSGNFYGYNKDTGKMEFIESPTISLQETTPVSIQQDELTAESLVNQHGGTLEQALDFVRTHPTGTTAYDLGYEYRNRLIKPAPTTTAGTQTETTRPVPELSDLQGKMTSLFAEQEAASAPQQRQAIGRKIEAISSQMDRLDKEEEKTRTYYEKQVAPVVAQLDQASELSALFSLSSKGNVPATQQMKMALTKLGGDNRVSAPEVKAVTGGGDIVRRFNEAVHEWLKGGLSPANQRDIGQIIGNMQRLYTEIYNNKVSKGLSRFGKTASPSVVGLYLNKLDQYVVGQTYVDAGGKRAIYLGSGEWEDVK